MTADRTGITGGGDGARSTAEGRLRAALRSPGGSTRLQAALSAGTYPAPAYIDALVERFGLEPELNVRETLTWALTRHDPQAAIDRLTAELGSTSAQARRQALHTLSKIGDARGWPAITDALLQDADDEVARTAWRTAAALVPGDRVAGLARILATQFGRGDEQVQASLSRVFATLGEPAAPVVDEAGTASDRRVRLHAVATARIMRDPTASFEVAMTEARRLAGAPTRLAVVPVDWDDARGEVLREAQQAEIRGLYGGQDTEPGVKPTADDIAVFVVALDGARPVGCGGLRRIDDVQGEIKRMYVAPSARGGAVARAILDALEEAARGSGWERLVLETGIEQHAAMRFYEREGYERIPPFGAYVGSATSVCYGRELA